MTFVIRKCSLASSVNLYYRRRNIDFKMQVPTYSALMKKKKEKGEQSERSWSLLHLILMSVLWLSRFRRTQLLRWSDWMTEITCLESPTRQLIDNAWQKNVFVYPQIWLWAGFQFLLFFFLRKPDSLDWSGLRREYQVRRSRLWVNCGVWLHTYHLNQGRGSSTSYSSHPVCVVLKGI